MLGFFASQRENIQLQPSGVVRHGAVTLLSRLRRGGIPQSDEQPLRAELFSTDQLEQHAKALAARHKVDYRGGPDRLLHRLEENEPVLFEAYQLVAAAVSANRQMSPADEWLLDNFYMIEEQIRTARRHLPKNYSRELPRLLNGPLVGFPRVYEIALELISHVDGRVSLESVIHFIAAYQTVTPLTLGELWGIPIVLRLALIENLRRVAANMTGARIRRDAAHRWADRLIEVAESDPKSVIQVMAEMARTAPEMGSEFVAEFARRMHSQPEVMALPLIWLEQRLAEQAISIEQIVLLEGQQQAADQVSIGNSINSLRLLASMDWREFVESLSIVDQVLRGAPPAGLNLDGKGAANNGSALPEFPGYQDVYSAMDFATRRFLSPRRGGAGKAEPYCRMASRRKGGPTGRPRGKGSRRM